MLEILNEKIKNVSIYVANSFLKQSESLLGWHTRRLWKTWILTHLQKVNDDQDHMEDLKLCLYINCR